MEVRPARDQDLEEVVSVWHETRKKTHTALGFRSERGVTLDDSRRIFRESIAPSCQIWVAERRGEVVGFMAIRGSYIDRMYVRPDDQRGGVGTALLEKARELSPDDLALHTHRANRSARAFYEKHGFRPVRFGVSPPPESEPDVEYRWRPA
jgi:ribosomal protein S18 acetylase RimI-like enzyme